VIPRAGRAREHRRPLGDRGPVSPRELLRRLYVAAAGIVGLLLMVQAVPQLQAALADTPWDLNIDRLTARAYLDHYSPFTPGGAARSGVAASGPAGNGHPPTTSFWTLPLARMDARNASATLALITVVLLLIELLTTMTLLGVPAPTVSAWLALGYVLTCSFMKVHIALGQMSGLIGFLFFAGWTAGRRGDDAMAGAALGAACTMKMFPGVVLLLFLFTRRWRAVAAAAVVYLAIAAIMTARFGLLSWPQFFAQQGPIADRWMGDIQNQSLHGIVFRLFRPVCVWHGPVILSATLISAAVAALLIALAGWLVWRTDRGRGFDAAYALFVVLAVVTSQWTWEHYTVIYALPVLILAAELAASLRARRRSVAAAAMLLALAAIVAAWRIDLATKGALQVSVHQGHRQDHLRLHLYDVLNWAPGLGLLILLFVVCAWERTDRLRTPARLSPPAS
jgi:hypothetical protein